MFVEDFIQKVSYLIQNDLPFSLFNQPDDATVFLYYQTDNTLFTSSELDFEGFVIAPFHWDGSFTFIPNTHQLTISKQDLLAYFKGKDQQNEQLNIANTKQEEMQYQKLIMQAIATINSSDLEKVVCSRKQVVATKIDQITTFVKMLRTYPFAFNYCFQHSKLGQWMGATPELLLAYQNERMQTVALAGTQAYVADKKTYHWRQKECDEQQTVTDYIVSNLENLGFDLKVTSAKTAFAGKVVHLKSIIAIKITKPKLINVLKTLHPTPAVCGFPLDKSLAFIASFEDYHRLFYTGFVGVVNTDALAIYVNLRCMEVNAQNVAIYVGGGVNSASNPTEEWQETVLKSTVLAQVICKK